MKSLNVLRFQSKSVFVSAAGPVAKLVRSPFALCSVLAAGAFVAVLAAGCSDSFVSTCGDQPCVAAESDAGAADGGTKPSGDGAAPRTDAGPTTDAASDAATDARVFVPKACGGDVALPRDPQALTPTDTLHVLLGNTPGAALSAANGTYRTMPLAPGGKWRMRLQVAPGDSTRGYQNLPGFLLGFEDNNGGARMRISLSRSCQEFGADSQPITDGNADGMWTTGSFQFKSADDPRPGAVAIITEPGLWYVNVEMPLLPADACGETACRWNVFYKAAR